MNKHLNKEAIENNLPLPAERQEGVVFLALHGRNQEPIFMQQVIQNTGLGDYPYIIPWAADKAWYNDKFMAPLANNQPELDMALDSIGHYHDRLLSLGYSNEQIILIGFSQGACLVSQYALQHPNCYKAIIILTGGYIGPENVDWGFEGDFLKTPVYITTSKIDEWVPPHRTEATAREFEKLNASVTYDLFEDRPHEVSTKELNQIKSMI